MSADCTLGIVHHDWEDLASCPLPRCRRCLAAHPHTVAVYHAARVFLHAVQESPIASRFDERTRMALDELERLAVKVGGPV